MAYVRSGVQPSTPRPPARGPRLPFISTVLACVMAIAACGAIAGCGSGSSGGGGGTPSPAPESGEAGDATGTNNAPQGSEEALQAEAGKQAAEAKRREAASEGEAKARQEALGKAQKAEAVHSTSRKQARGSGKRTSARKRAKRVPRRTATPATGTQGGGSPAEVKARARFAQEEAEEVARARRLEGQPAPPKP